MIGKIYTIGFTKKTAESFFNVLKENRVELVLDIRLNNTSQLSAFAKFSDIRYFLKVIGGIEYIHDTKFSPKETTLKRYKKKDIDWSHYVTEFNDTMDERDIIYNLFETVFTSKSDLKLLNFYKGLALNTQAKIIKINNYDLYVRFESLQGLVMKSEGETILQSSRFTKDIRATVKHINMEKKIVILTNFHLLKTSSISRKYSRVTTSSKTLVVQIGRASCRERV